MELQEKFEWAQRALSFYDYEQAEKLAWEIREERPDLTSAYLLLGNIYTNTHRHHEAVNAYQQAVEIDSDTVEGYNNLGIAYRKTGSIEAALEAFQRAHDLSPERADITYNLANCHKQLHNDPKAEGLYREALRQDPAFLMVYNNLGTLYQRRGDTDKAIELFNQGLAYDPNHPTLRFNLGIAQERLGNFDQAIGEYRRSLKSKPGWSSALNNLGVALQKVERHREAEQAFQDLLRVEPDNFQAYNNIGVLLAAQQKYEEAEEYFNKSLSLNSEYKSAIVNLGKMYVESGEGTKARERLQSVLESDPENHEVRFELAGLLLGNGQANAALHHIHRLIHVDHNNPDYLFLLGKTRHKLGSNEKALPPLGNALKLRPAFEAAIIELGYTLGDMSRYEEANRRLQGFLRQNPGSVNVMITLAELELDRNNPDKALSEFQELNKTYPKNERILKGLLSAFQRLGNREEALRVAEELVHLFGNPEDNEDFSKLEAGLQLYEQIVNELVNEKPSDWQKNLRQILNEEQEGNDEFDQYLQDMSAESEDDIEGEMVPIIDVGGIEPVIAVNEEEGDPVNLETVEEDIEPPEELPDEEEPEKFNAAIAVEHPDTEKPQPWYPPQYPPQNPPQYPPQYPSHPPAQIQQVPDQQPVRQPIQSAAQPNRDPSYSGTSRPSAPQQGGAASSPSQAVPPQPAPPRYIPYPVYTQPPPADTIPAPAPEKPATPEAVPDIPETAGTEQPDSEQPPEDQPLYPQDMDTLEDLLMGDEETDGTEEKAGKPETFGDPRAAQGLFDYLADLIEYLPRDERIHYEESDMKLRVEALRTRLNGRGGLHSLAQKYKGNNGFSEVQIEFEPDEKRSVQQAEEAEKQKSLLKKSDLLKPEPIRSALAYLQNLSQELPNPSIGVALKRKIHDIIEKLQD